MNNRKPLESFTDNRLMVIHVPSQHNYTMIDQSLVANSLHVLILVLLTPYNIDITVNPLTFNPSLCYLFAKINADLTDSMRIVYTPKFMDILIVCMQCVC